MTGADNSIQPEELFKVSSVYPFVEWGILLSRNSQGKNRFPSTRWMDDLAIQNEGFLNLSGHLCGAYVREFLMGSDRCVGEIGAIWKFFSRIQINTHGIKHDWDKDGLLGLLEKHSDKEFIFQYDNANTEILNALSGTANISTLFDLSHGAGILPSEWPQPITGVKCGYAGGLSPENVKAQIEKIESIGGDKGTWIDMETHIRSAADTIFDLDKVKAVLSICEPKIYKVSA